MTDLFGGREARDVGMAKAAANADAQFFRDAFAVLKEFKGQEIITEDVKLRMQMRGCSLPDSHQVWGSWTKDARKCGAIIPVKAPDGKQKLRQCRKRESHARDSKVYRVK
jgi:hypothetical protein